MYRGDPLYGHRGPRDNYAVAPAVGMCMDDQTK